MIELIFQGGSEFVKLEMDRKNKHLFIYSSLTNYQRKRAEWFRLFDKGKERIQEKETDKMDDAQFTSAIISSMGKIGYKLKETVI
jgi:hypothetical protein